MTCDILVCGCILSSDDWENDLKHSLQVNGLSPEWGFRWVLSLDDWENDLEHSWQVNGFSPEWVLRWVLSSCSNVFIKIAWIGKWFKTFFTSKWLLSWMSSTMGFKISWWRKWLVTFFTSIWMCFKFGWLRKLFGKFFYK